MSKPAAPVRGNRIGQVAAILVAVVALAAIVGSSALVLSKPKQPGGHGLDVRTLSGDTRQAYEIASTHQDLFVHVPCYCGCAALVEPHRDLVDCFFEAPGVFGTHASTCSTCVDIALTAARALTEGLDHAQIRALVDAQFSARGPGTATAYP